MSEAKLFDQEEAWAVVEVMGHNTFAGKVSEAVCGGAGFIRVDVPEIPETRTQRERRRWNSNDDGTDYITETYEHVIEAVPAFTKLIGAGSIYAITPCSEGVARKVAEQKRVVPVNVLDMPTSSGTRLLESSGDPDEDDED